MKITIIGSSGKVARQTVQAAYNFNVLPEIEMVLISQNPDLVNGYVLDLQSVSALRPSSIVEPVCTITDDYSKISDSDYVFVCAGQFMERNKKEEFRKYDSSGRLAHTFESLNLIYDIAKNIKEHSPNSTVIVVTNQSDMMAQILRGVLPTKQVYGFGGMLDEARFTKILSQELNTMIPNQHITPQDVSAEIVGYHNNDMVLIKDSIQVPERATEELIKRPNLLTKVLEQTKAYGREISKNADTRHPTMHTGASIGPGIACWTAISALSGQTSSLKASFNEQLDVEQSKMYGLEEGVSLSVPWVLSPVGFKSIKGAVCDQKELQSIKQAAHKMSESMVLLENLHRNIA